MSSNPPPVARPDPAAALLSLGANPALCVRRDDRAFVGFAHLNLLLLFWSARRFDLTPPGSAARARARLAVWVLTATLTAAFTSRMCEVLPPPLAAAAWVTAAATVGGGFYLLFVREAKLSDRRRSKSAVRPASLQPYGARSYG